MVLYWSWLFLYQLFAAPFHIYAPRPRQRREPLTHSQVTQLVLGCKKLTVWAWCLNLFSFDTMEPSQLQFGDCIGCDLDFKYPSKAPVFTYSFMISLWDFSESNLGHWMLPLEGIIGTWTRSLFSSFAFWLLWEQFLLPHFPSLLELSVSLMGPSCCGLNSLQSEPRSIFPPWSDLYQVFCLSDKTLTQSLNFTYRYMYGLILQCLLALA